MSKGHTYENWQELGYQVKRGESATYQYYGKKIFIKNQVFWIGHSKEEEQEYEYSNYCWNCKSGVTHYDTQCEKCNWYSCNSCGSCGCDR